MNDVLCEFPAQYLYGPGYRSANEAIARRRLELDTSATSTDAFIEAVLDPDHPSVVCVIEGLKAGAENIVEAGLVADIVAELRKRLKQGNGQLYPDTGRGDRLFWKEGLFIVSPHHVQIRAIRKALADRGLRPPFFVDTVDKMQGQECDCVIVSYGVSDPEYAMLEGEFIYSLNRLNVAITRARVKSIVFLPRPLLSPTLQTLEDPTAIEGISYMLGLENFTTSRGSRLSFHMRDGVEFIMMKK